MAGNEKLYGVLALQGDYEKHQQSLTHLGARTIFVKTLDELSRVHALVIPGGESTTMLRLLDYYGMFDILRKFGAQKPIFGTCAGAILMARTVSSPAQKSLDLMDMDVERNAYGRQVDSRIVRLDSALGDLEAVFIRAPIIRRTGPGVEVLASYLGDAVLVRQGRHLAASFHPELTGDTRVHQYFMDIVEA
ncbi:MAG: pyridoxal 5'-phosphate synthase glutaminase subunit PdxT [Bryobacter sp.]|nr:pyridoxal 5'-phosphate synthase glutaminase subunit PdxT [Bryobacter sp. CoA8 C33]